jgi:hypothetical protein
MAALPKRKWMPKAAGKQPADKALSRPVFTTETVDTPILISQGLYLWQ